MIPTMKLGFVHDGPLRFVLSEEYQTRYRELRSMVAAKYTAELSNAGFFHWFLVRYQMHKEYQRAVSEITPSAQRLWFGCFITSPGDQAKSHESENGEKTRSERQSMASWSGRAA
jgi:hypothetical protein